MNTQYLILSSLLIFQGSFAFSASDFFGVTVSQTHYAGDAQIAEQESRYAAATPYINYRGQNGNDDSVHQIFKAEAFAVLPMSDNVDIGVAIPELYYSFVDNTLAHQYQVSVGRKRENWSELDSFWNLGLWQPLVRWDSASPVEQGLFGAFIEYRYLQKSRAVFLLSNIYLPDQQPTYEEKDGDVISRNRWFRAPVSRANLQNVGGEINYQVKEPDVSDLIMQESYAIMFELGSPLSGAFFKASHTDKVANQFHLGIDIEGTASIKSGDYSFSAPIYPTIVRHKLYSLESGYAFNYTRFVLSANLEEYDKPSLPADYQQTELIDSLYSGVIVSQSLLPFGLKRSSLDFSYVQRELSKDAKKSTIIKGDIEASTQRFLFEDIAGVEFKTNLKRTYRHQVDASLKYVYTFNDSGEWIQLGAHYKFDRNWIWAISGDLFGVPDGTSPETSFISKFRGNDRVSGSLTYVF